MSNLAAHSVAHGKNMSATRQLGLVFCKYGSSCSLSSSVAAMNLTIMPSPLTSSMFSNPSGRPASSAGNLNSSTSMTQVPIFLAVSTALLKMGALRGVVMMVTLTP
uniref:Uncharacterized protein n=1 Tax=Opuntia streptacantha TaxID=393608 RepID=A0A7C9A0Q3_OPUST